jgi:hypothetical protein
MPVPAPETAAAVQPRRTAARVPSVGALAATGKSGCMSGAPGAIESWCVLTRALLPRVKRPTNNTAWFDPSAKPMRPRLPVAGRSGCPRVDIPCLPAPVRTRGRQRRTRGHEVRDSRPETHSGAADGQEHARCPWEHAGSSRCDPEHHVAVDQDQALEHAEFDEASPPPREAVEPAGPDNANRPRIMLAAGIIGSESTPCLRRTRSAVENAVA